MKKRTLFVVAVITAVSLLAFLAFANDTQESGYEVFKSVMKNHKTIESESGQVTGSLTVKDNGITIITIDGLLKGNESTSELGGNLNLTIGDFEKTLDFYGFENMMYILDKKNGDVYVGSDSEGMTPREYENPEAFDEKGEAILDVLVGDLAYEFELITDSDGTTDVRFELTKDEMPVLINLLTSMSQGETHFKHDEADFHDESLENTYPLFKELMGVEAELTELVSDIEVEYLQITLDLDSEEQVQGLSFTVEVSGLDSDSKSHLISVDASLTIQPGDVTIDKIDLNLFNVYELPEDETMGHKNR